MLHPSTQKLPSLSARTFVVLFLLLCIASFTINMRELEKIIYAAKITASAVRYSDLPATVLSSSVPNLLDFEAEDSKKSGLSSARDAQLYNHVVEAGFNAESVWNFLLQEGSVLHNNDNLGQQSSSLSRQALNFRRSCSYQSIHIGIM